MLTRMAALFPGRGPNQEARRIGVSAAGQAHDGHDVPLVSDGIGDIGVDGVPHDRPPLRSRTDLERNEVILRLAIRCAAETFHCAIATAIYHPSGDLSKPSAA